MDVDTDPLTPDRIRELVASLKFWWHRIDLGNGIVTPGQTDSGPTLRALHLPDRLDGKTVLDIGPWDGLYSFEAERRGAARVVAADHYVWTLPAIGDGGFDIAHAALQSKVEKKLVAVEDISSETVGGVFDLVLFLGVLYHAQNPMLYLRKLRSVCGGTAIIETHVDGLDYQRPMMVFYPKDTLVGDYTNFWGPNELAVRDMLLEVGFARVEMVDHYSPTRMVFHAFV